ncbi:MAG: LysO family transporter [Phascolarctobacterium sp.]
MTIIICAIAAGILLGWLDVFNYKTKLWLNRFSTVCLFIILLCLGAKIGCDKEMLDKIPVLGQQAFILGSSTILGSMVMFYLIIKLLAPNFDKENEVA